MLAEVVQGSKWKRTMDTDPRPGCLPAPSLPTLASTSQENCKGSVSTTRIERYDFAWYDAAELVQCGKMAGVV